MRTTHRNGVSAFVIGPLAIPFSFFWTLVGLLGVGWLAFCVTLDVAFGGKGAGAGLFFIPLFGIGAIVLLSTLIRMLIKHYRAVNGEDQ